MNKEIEIDIDDYMEGLLKHLIRDRKVFEQAHRLDLSPEDFMVNDSFGMIIYKEFADVIFTIGFSPIKDANIFMQHLKRKFDDNILVESQLDDVATLVVELYKDIENDFILNETSSLIPSPKSTLISQYYIETMATFIKKQRTNRLTLTHKNDPDILAANLNALAIKLSFDTTESEIDDFSPFDQPVYKNEFDLVGTGIARVDEKIKGLGLGEYAIVVGFSGGGKTVLATNIAANCASMGKKVSVISCEETKEDLCQRFYSKYFELPYSVLHSGGEMAKAMLDDAFANQGLMEHREVMKNNLNLISLKGRTPVNGDQIYEILLNKYEKTGWVPEVVIIDQLQFVEPRQIQKNTQPWQLEKQTSAELDELSHKKIGGYNFALWVLHQAKGKLRRNFTREDIDGFKGVIHKADLVLGVGRDGISSNECDIFSLKVRHCPDFSVTVGTDFKYMRYVTTGTNNNLEGYTRPATNITTDPGPLILPAGLPAVPFAT